MSLLPPAALFQRPLRAAIQLAPNLSGLTSQVRRVAIAAPDALALSLQNNALRMPKCNKCKVPLVDGFAIPRAVVGGNHDERTMSYGNWVGIAPLVPVLKCPKCGRSITK